jgi:hypothetical protein
MDEMALSDAGMPDEWDDRVQMISTGRVDVDRLRRSVDGQVMLPGEDGYDSARALWNAMVDRRPAVVVRCASSPDVATAGC